MRRSAVLLILLLAIVGACSSPGAATTGPQAPPQGEPDDTSGPPDVEPGGTGTVVTHVEVASGPLAGTYDDTGEKLDCNISGTGSGATHLDLEATEGLAGVTFVSGEGGANPAKFYLQVSFADPEAGLLQQPSLEISALGGVEPRGTGSARLEDKGATIKWSVDGTTEDGIGLKATVECGPVDRR